MKRLLIALFFATCVYAQNQFPFTNTLGLVVPGTNFSSANLVGDCYDNTGATPVRIQQDAGFPTVNPNTFAVTFRWQNAGVLHTGYCTVTQVGVPTTPLYVVSGSGSPVNPCAANQIYVQTNGS